MKDDLTLKILEVFVCVLIVVAIAILAAGFITALTDIPCRANA